MEKTDKGHRIYLNVPYEEKDAAKKLGARWDPEQRKWYIPPSMTVNVSKKTSVLLSKWNIGSTGDEDQAAMTNETRQIYQKINHVLDISAKSDNDGLD